MGAEQTRRLNPHCSSGHTPPACVKSLLGGSFGSIRAPRQPPRRRPTPRVERAQQPERRCELRRCRARPRSCREPSVEHRGAGRGHGRAVQALDDAHCAGGHWECRCGRCGIAGRDGGRTDGAHPQVPHDQGDRRQRQVQAVAGQRRLLMPLDRRAGESERAAAVAVTG